MSEVHVRFRESTLRLHIARGLSFPAEEFIESKVGILGISGSGKTGIIKRILEECDRAGLPFVVFDPGGTLWGHKSSYDGTGPGCSAIVVGGDHADLPLQRNGGAQVAEAIVAANVSVIVDLSKESKATYRTFAKDFAETLYAKNDSPRLVVIDEAPELVPQNLKGRPELAATYDAIERLVRQGRNRGLGVILASQRAATISKDVLTQVGSLFVFRLIGTPDRKALREWVDAYGAEERLKEFEEGLATLETRQCWYWSPTDFRRFEKVRVLDFHTLHADRTHLRKLGLLHAKPVTKDVSKLVEKLGATLAKVAQEKNDAAQVPVLRSKIRALEAQVEKAMATPVVGDTLKADFKRLEASVIRMRSSLDAYRAALGKANSVIQKVREVGGRLASAPTAILPPGLANPEQPLGIVASGLVADTAREPRPFIAGDLRPRPSKREIIRPDVLVPGEDNHLNPLKVGDPTHLKSGAVRMLKTIASRHPLTLTYAQLATLSGFTPSGGTATTYYSALRRLGYLEVDSSGTVRATEAGLAFLGTDVPPSPATHEEVMAMWERNLKSGAYRMLRSLAGSYPNPMTREALAVETGFEMRGGTFSTYLGLLVRNGLVMKDGNDVRATSILWPEGP